MATSVGKKIRSQVTPNIITPSVSHRLSIVAYFFVSQCLSNMDSTTYSTLIQDGEFKISLQTPLLLSTTPLHTKILSVHHYSYASRHYTQFDVQSTNERPLQCKDWMLERPRKSCVAIIKLMALFVMENMDLEDWLLVFIHNSPTLASTKIQRACQILYKIILQSQCCMSAQVYTI